MGGTHPPHHLLQCLCDSLTLLVSLGHAQCELAGLYHCGHFLRKVLWQNFNGMGVLPTILPCAMFPTTFHIRVAYAAHATRDTANVRLLHFTYAYRRAKRCTTCLIPPATNRAWRAGGDAHTHRAYLQQAFARNATSNLPAEPRSAGGDDVGGMIVWMMFDVDDAYTRRWRDGIPYACTRFTAPPCAPVQLICGRVSGSAIQPLTRWFKFAAFPHSLLDTSLRDRVGSLRGYCRRAKPQ